MRKLNVNIDRETKAIGGEKTVIYILAIVVIATKNIAIYMNQLKILQYI
jgi:hypothetical protein